MAAYVIAEISVHDPDLYEEYKGKAAASIAEHGGVYRVRGGVVAALEGGAVAGRVVVLEFPSLARAREWYESVTYREARAIRWRSATGRVFIVEGVEP